MLAGLALKKNWQRRRRAAGLSTDKPNLVMAYSVQVRLGFRVFRGFRVLRFRV
jgi:glutamate/tyrosine decarboxylase-like PLP-dependent enzyme